MRGSAGWMAGWLIQRFLGGGGGGGVDYGLWILD
jgi:hypothetical protein